MPLIDGPLIEIPDEDGWRDDFAGRVMLVLLGAFMFGTGYRFWAGIAETGRLTLALSSLLLSAVGVQCLIWAVSGVDLSKHGRKIALGTVALLTALTIIALVATGSQWIKRASTDVILFNSYSAELILSGLNPYEASMAPAHAMYPDDMMTKFWTWRTDGTLVDSFSYPAGAALALVPQLALVGRDPIGLRFTVIVATGVLGALLVWMLPAQYALAAPLSLLASRNFWITAAGGVIEALWLVPFVAALWLWTDKRYITGAALIGVAAATKQFAWLSIPFLAVWILRETDVRTIVGTATAGATVFTAINLPFIVANPSAWLGGVFTPLGSEGAPLVVEGSGLAGLYLAGLTFPRWVFTAAVATAGLGGLVLYWRHFERVKWVAWVIPPAILLWHDRSLMSYFTAFVPVAMVAAAAAHDRLRASPRLTLAVQRLTSTEGEPA